MLKLAKTLKLDRWIAEGAPAFWVLGMTFVFSGATLGILEALVITFDWPYLKPIISWVLCVLIASLVGLILWFVVDALTAKERPKTWR